MDIKHAGFMFVIALCVGFVTGIVFEKWQGDGVTGATTTETAEKESDDFPRDFKEKLHALYGPIPDDAFIAEITDITIVKNQQPQIYKDARNGDYIVAFADKVIVYDYENNQIITKHTFT